MEKVNLILPFQTFSQRESYQVRRARQDEKAKILKNLHKKDNQMAQTSLETISNLEPDAVIKKAKRFFVGEWGLEVVDEAECCLRLEGGGGHVYIQATPEEGRTTVSLEGREWTDQLVNFMADIAAQ